MSESAIFDPRFRLDVAEPETRECMICGKPHCHPGQVGTYSNQEGLMATLYFRGECAAIRGLTGLQLHIIYLETMNSAFRLDGNGGRPLVLPS